MRFDFVIANPPYGKTGNKITRNIVENVDYECFVNLLPANDYRRYERDFKLFQFIDMSTLKPIANGFKDATVTSMLCRVMKERQLIHESRFEAECYTDESLENYFSENIVRTNRAIDNSMYQINPEIFMTLDAKKTVCIGLRDPNHGHLPYSESSITNLYNHSKITNDEMLKYCMSFPNYRKRNQVGAFIYIQFDTELEKSNIVDFMYSEDGFRFMSKIFTALNVDSYISPKKFMPKVDWTRPQTVQSILLDYGYNEQEIDDILEDLKNYRYMDEAK